MATKSKIDRISVHLEHGQLQEARALISQARAEGEQSADLFYLEGKLYMKQSQWGDAISSFLKAEEMDAASPARQCREMLQDILAFYNKDMYNQ